MDMGGAINDLRDRLEASLESPTKIRDMTIFTCCVDELERLSSPMQLTKKDLLESRIGKTINDLRRELPSKEGKLAKRLKALVRIWSTRLIESEEPTSTPPTLIAAPENGTTVPSSPVIPNGVLTTAATTRTAPVKPPEADAVSPKVGRAKSQLTITLKRSRAAAEEPPAVVKKPRVDSRPNTPDSPGNPLTPDAAGIPSRILHRPKVKTHDQILKDLQAKNPDLLPAEKPVDKVPCDVTLKSSVIAAKEEDMEEPAGPSGPRVDPVDAELADILKNLPPLSAADGPLSWDVDEASTSATTTSSGEVARGTRDADGHLHNYTEAFVDRMQSGEKVVVLPYVYFPFPRP
ncbi:mediator of RNA polymerase II transcription subunit 26-like [Paramacrobiotus metropolitanus]|uniref:mediator of RNA polymerase II transcription subunit 26-like n=1 Tax=Paramacrobiotus metropolitanus TaxID=2943436 RepID=UPI002445F840|nr:mediator of RNA polymerase II transcription subunit 26-like [Paramacrobiotus metropolitanus]